MGSSRGRFILIEGLDRSGKSTQASLLSDKIPNSKLLKFPDRSTPIGKLINAYLTDTSFTLSDQSAHLLFSANRWEIAEQIVNDLNSGINLVVDRYIFSGVAYSLAKSRFSKQNVSEISNINWLLGPDIGLPSPDLTIFLTLSIEELANRKGWGEERYEKVEFQKVVKECYNEVLTSKGNSTGDHSVVSVNVDNKGIEEVERILWDIISEREMNSQTDKPIFKVESADVHSSLSK